MTTAVLGNSHIIAIQQAFNRAPRASLPAMDFFFIPGNWEWCGKQGAAGQGSQLRRLPSADKDVCFDIGECESLVVGACGCWAARNEVVEVKGNPRHPLGAVASADWLSDSSRVPANLQFVSRAVFEATVEAWVRSHPATRLAMSVADRFRNQVIMLPVPAPDRALKSDQSWCLNRWFGSNGPSAWRDFFAAQHRAIKAIAGELGPQFTLFDYPIQDPYLDGFMDSSWCNKDDPWHASERYGALVLDQIASS